MNISTIEAEPMQTSYATGGRPAGATESSSSAVSWAAILGGAVAAAAMALILLALGAGLGFSSISPWSNAGASAGAIGLATALWLLAVQVISSGLGGYLVGRLRTRWVGIHTDEVFFRDTAHGLLAWAVAALIGASILAAASSSLLGATGRAAGVIASGATSVAASAAAVAGGRRLSDTGPEFVDTLLRPDAPRADADDAAVRAETGRILAASLANGGMSSADKAYLAKVVAARTGVSESDASQRIDDVVAQAKAAADSAELKARQAADAARKAAAYLSLWSFVALLSGAFSASLFATYGGRLRDRVTLVPLGREARLRA